MTILDRLATLVKRPTGKPASPAPSAPLMVERRASPRFAVTAPACLISERVLELSFAGLQLYFALQLARRALRPAEG